MGLDLDAWLCISLVGFILMASGVRVTVYVAFNQHIS